MALADDKSPMRRFQRLEKRLRANQLQGSREVLWQARLLDMLEHSDARNFVVLAGSSTSPGNRRLRRGRNRLYTQPEAWQFEQTSCMAARHFSQFSKLTLTTGRRVKLMRSPTS
jgi:phosphodiesterase/alkaline phosphatase D-like protein